MKCINNVRKFLSTRNFLKLVLFSSFLWNFNSFFNFKHKKRTLLAHKQNSTNSIKNCVLQICSGKKPLKANGFPVPIIYFITPTFAKREQIAILTRLEQTLRLIPNLVWVLVEAQIKRKIIKEYLERSCVHYIHLSAKTRKNITKMRERGLNYVKTDVSVPNGAVFYFGDADNTYDVELFDNLRKINKVAVWPVAFLRNQLVEKPKLKSGKIVGWDTSNKNRKFPFDISAFGVNLTWFNLFPTADVFYEYLDSFFHQLNITPSDLEIFGMSETETNRVLVWKTVTWSFESKKGDGGYIV